MRFDFDRRAAGVLLHPTSLPGRFGSGDLGPEALALADWLGRAGLRVWQMLPVGPVGYGHSPYSAQSAFAGSPLLVSPERLFEEGLLGRRELDEAPALPHDRVDFARTLALRRTLLRRAFERHRQGPQDELEAFRAREAPWLEEFVLYRALKRSQDERAWLDWPAPLRTRDADALARARAELSDELAFHRFEQFQFDRQWRALREACDARGIALVGDLPIFVAHDSADVWAHPGNWKLDAEGRPTVVAGVPPDYFSATGQRWGNPLYRWDELRESGFSWWIDRFRHTLSRFDAVRLDHFIGFHRAWEIPAGEPTAEHGTFVPAPGAELFDRAKAELGELPFIAEDLGLVTPEVHALRERFGFPGLRILQFAFGTDLQAENFLPHNYVKKTIVYTGTHDNDTAVGWFREAPGRGTRDAEQIERERRRALAYLGGGADEVAWSMVRAALVSVANLAVLPMQDVLGLDGSARMNRPGEAEGNWEWRLDAHALDEATAARLRELVDLSGRRA